MHCCSASSWKRSTTAGRTRAAAAACGSSSARGFLGGFTTYSTLAESTAALFLNERGLTGTGCALLTVPSGAITTACGLVAASWIRPREARQQALDRLPEAQRRCWVLKELFEYSYDEIATELELPPSTVRGLLSRARKNMIKQMEDWR